MTQQEAIHTLQRIVDDMEHEFRDVKEGKIHDRCSKCEGQRAMDSLSGLVATVHRIQSKR